MEWIKLYKKFQDWEWYKNSNTKCLFIHLLLNANWKDGKYQGHEIKRGSLVVGLNALSEQTGMTIQQIRTSLNHLLSTNEIVKKSTNKFSIITIVKYEDYQRDTREDNKQLTNKQQTTNKQLTTIEEYKNNRYIDIKEKINKKEKDFEELWKIYPNKKGKTNAYKKYLKTKVDDETIRQGILNYISYIKLKKIQPQFIKHGSTWFNEEAWNDDYSEVVENIEDKKARFEEMMKYR